MVAKQQKTSNNIWHRGFNGSIKISFTHHCPSAHPSYQPTASAPMDSFQFFASVQVPELCHGCVLLWVQIVFQLRILVPDDAALHSSFFFQTWDHVYIFWWMDASGGNRSGCNVILWDYSDHQSRPLIVLVFSTDRMTLFFWVSCKIK